MTTTLTMKPSELRVLLAAAIKAKQPVLIVSPPGVGKTSIVKLAAADAGADLVITHPAVKDPTDASGMPWVADGKAVFIPIGETAKVLAATKLTVWLWDDIGQAPPATQASYMPWLLEGELNGNKLPDCVVVIACTNRRTDRAGVSGILEPVKSRFATIVHLEPDVGEWATWALEQDYMPPVLVAYIRFQSDALCQFEPTADLVNCPIPRTWEKAGRLLSMGLPSAIERKAVAGAIGEAQTAQFFAFREMFEQLPAIEEILADPKKAKIPTQLGPLYATVTGLAAKTTVTNFPAVAVYAQRLWDDAKGDFAGLLIRDAARRTPAIQPTAPFAKMMAGPLGKMMAGQ